MPKRQREPKADAASSSSSKRKNMPKNPAAKKQPAKKPGAKKVADKPPSDQSSSSGHNIVLDNDIDAEGTSMQGHLMASTDLLISLFDYPIENDYDHGDCEIEWHFRDSAGARWTIYDWKMSRFLGRFDPKNPSCEEFQFNIGGDSGADPSDFREYLRGEGLTEVTLPC